MPCEGWLRFLVGQKRSSSSLVILKSCPMLPAYVCHCHLWKYRHRVYWILWYPLIILKVAFLKSNPFRFKETLISFNIKQKWHHEKGGAIRHCATGNVDQTNFWFIFFSILWHKILSSHIICSYLRRLVIQNSLKCKETLQIFFNPLPNPIGIFFINCDLFIELLLTDLCLR